MLRARLDQRNRPRGRPRLRRHGHGKAAYLDHAPEHAGLRCGGIAWAWWALAALVLLAADDWRLAAYRVAQHGAELCAWPPSACLLAGAAPLRTGSHRSRRTSWIFDPTRPTLAQGIATLVINGAVFANGLYSAAVLFMGLPASCG